MTNSENTNQTTPSSTNPATAVAIERPSRKAWWIAGAGIGLAIVLGATALGVSVADAAEGDRDDHDSSQVGGPGPEVGPMDQDDRDDRDDSNDGQTAGPSGPAVGDDAPISADERQRATDAALAEVGNGTVTDVDRSDDLDHAWEVEVLLADGTDIDVELDADFSVVRVDTDN